LAFVFYCSLSSCSPYRHPSPWLKKGEQELHLVEKELALLALVRVPHPARLRLPVPLPRKQVLVGG
jgi:hypothetical protein